MRITLFGVDEANRMLAQVRPELEKLRAQHREFDKLEVRIGVLLVATSGADAENPDSLELRSLTEKRRRLGESIGRAISQLHEKGVMLKDLESGLCDFYALMGDRLVFLCWRLGEPEIGHWHALDEGFAGRRPLKNAELE